MSSIPLMVAPAPQVQGPLQQAQSATSLQALINQTRMQQQAIQQQQAMAPIQQQQAQAAAQQQQIAAQQAQQEYDDTQKFNQAFRDANGDWDQTIQNATSAGASGAFITKAQMARANQVAQMAKAHSDVLDNQQKQLDLVGQGAIRLKNITDPGQRLTAQHQLFNELVSEGIDPAHLQDLNSGALTDSQLDQHINDSKAALQMVKDAQDAQSKAIAQPAEKAAKQAETYRNYNSLLAPTTSDAEWQAVRAQIPDELKTEFPEHWSPQNAQDAAHNSLTTEQQVTAGTSKAAQDSRYMNIQMKIAQRQPLTSDETAFKKAWEAKTDRETLLRGALARQPFDITGSGPAAPSFPGAPSAPAAVNPATPSAPTAAAPGAATVPANPQAPNARPQTVQTVQPGAPAKPATDTETAATNPKVIQGASPTDPGGWAAKVDAWRDPTNGRPMAPQYKALVLKNLNYLSPDAPPNARPNSPAWAIANTVQQIDPTHDGTQYGARNDVMKQYTKSAGDGQIGAINTALGHLGELYEAAKLLDGSDLPALHALQAKWHIAIGDDAAPVYKYIAGKVADETTSAYLKGGGGVTDRAADKGSFDIGNGQKAIIGTIGAAANLLNSKEDSLRQNWDRQFRPKAPEDSFDQRWLTPEARQTIGTLSQLSPTVKAAAAGNIPAGARTATNPSNGHKIYVQGNQWIDSVTGKPLGQ